MIYNDIYKYLLSHVSSKEFDICLYLVANQDWLGNVVIDYEDIAQACNTTIRYAKQVIRKLSSQQKDVLPDERRKPFIKPAPKFGENVYKLNLGLSKLEYVKGNAKYTKKFKFLYTQEFQSLSIAAKKLLLVAAFGMSSNQSATQRIKFKTFIGRNSGVRAMTKQRIYSAIEEINQAMNIVQTSVAYKLKQPYVEFIFDADVSQEFLSAEAEYELVKLIAFENGSDLYLTADYYSAILKTGKGFFNSLFKEIKAKKAFDHFEKLSAGLKSLYVESLNVLFQEFNKSKNEQTPEALSALLRGIILNKLTDYVASLSSEESARLQLAQNYMAAKDTFFKNNLDLLYDNFRKMKEEAAEIRKQIEVVNSITQQDRKTKLDNLKELIGKRNKVLQDLTSKNSTSHTIRNNLKIFNTEIERVLDNLNESISRSIDKTLSLLNVKSGEDRWEQLNRHLQHMSSLKLLSDREAKLIRNSLWDNSAIHLPGTSQIKIKSPKQQFAVNDENLDFEYPF
ncbi:hypothetical protein [Shouchella clausii]|uniref:hypothetical protein n=1 Tax=Shouchella clausii TaxID=79880 RepID=UPI001C72A053|nr:hypothetical protein [Shouchella clausii]MBX0320331.1 hypothetical protein [Shouchella clausii]MEB5480905.1 hypothetical protein [Shouchella clausii]